MAFTPEEKQMYRDFKATIVIASNNIIEIEQKNTKEREIAADNINATDYVKGQHLLRLIDEQRNDKGKYKTKIDECKKEITLILVELQQSNQFNPKEFKDNKLLVSNIEKIKLLQTQRDNQQKLSTAILQIYSPLISSLTSRLEEFNTAYDQDPDRRPAIAHATYTTMAELNTLKARLLEQPSTIKLYELQLSYVRHFLVSMERIIEKRKERLETEHWDQNLYLMRKAMKDASDEKKVRIILYYTKEYNRHLDRVKKGNYTDTEKEYMRDLINRNFQELRNLTDVDWSDETQADWMQICQMGSDLLDQALNTGDTSKYRRFQEETNNELPPNLNIPVDVIIEYRAALGNRQAAKEFIDKYREEDGRHNIYPRLTTLLLAAFNGTVNTRHETERAKTVSPDRKKSRRLRF